jgi:hypothetical protein
MMSSPCCAEEEDDAEILRMSSNKRRSDDCDAVDVDSKWMASREGDGKMMGARQEAGEA